MIQTRVCLRNKEEILESDEIIDQESKATKGRGDYKRKAWGGDVLFFSRSPSQPSLSEHIKIWLAEPHQQLRFSGAVPSTGHRVRRQATGREQNPKSLVFALLDLNSTTPGIGQLCHTI